MIFDIYKANKDLLADISVKVAALNATGAQGVFLDICSRKCQILPAERPMESAALQAAFTAGYREALADVFDFKERYVNIANPSIRAVAVDFGAADRLLKSGDITAEEYNKMINGEI